MKSQHREHVKHCMDNSGVKCKFRGTNGWFIHTQCDDYEKHEKNKRKSKYSQNVYKWISECATLKGSKSTKENNQGMSSKKEEEKRMEFSIKLAPILTLPNPPDHSPSGLSGWGYQKGWKGFHKCEKN